MGGLYSHTYRATGTVLTQGIYNGDHQSHIDNQTPQMTDDYSTNAAQMQSTADPYPGSVESLAGSLAGEVERLRYVIKQITGKDQWYKDPDHSLNDGIINVKDSPYNATGDGVTNDATALQDAFDALPNTYGALYFPRGIYQISGADLDWSGKAELGVFGAGANVSIIRQATSTENVVSIDNTASAKTNIRIHGLGFTRSSASTTNDGLYIKNVDLFTLSDIASAYSRYGLHTNDVRMGSIIAPILGSGNERGWNDVDGDALTLLGGWITENTARGISLLRTTVSLSGTFIRDNGTYGIYIDGDANVHADDIQITETAAPTIAIRSYSTTRVQVANSYLRGTLYAYLESAASAATLLVNNTYSGPVSLVTGSYRFDSAWNQIQVVATASLPAAGAANDGRILIEDAGAGDRNIIVYAGGQRFRVDGGAAV